MTVAPSDRLACALFDAQFLAQPELPNYYKAILYGHYAANAAIRAAAAALAKQESLLGNGDSNPVFQLGSTEDRFALACEELGLGP